MSWETDLNYGEKNKTFLHEAEDKVQDFLSAVHSWPIYSSLQRSAFVRDSNYGWLVLRGEVVNLQQVCERTDSIQPRSQSNIFLKYSA